MSQQKQRLAGARGEANERAAAISLLGGSTMTAFVQHRVKDYDAWRRVYDSVADMQKAGGVITESVYRAEGDSTSSWCRISSPTVRQRTTSSPARHSATRCDGRVWKRGRCGLNSSRTPSLTPTDGAFIKPQSFRGPIT
jgi:hypothetical protein